MRLLLSISLLASLAVTKTHTRSLCGVTYKTRAEIPGILSALQARVFRSNGVTTAFTSTPDALTLWWITSRTSRAYPAVACISKQPHDRQGFISNPPQVDCRQTNRTECARFARRISDAKF